MWGQRDTTVLAAWSQFKHGLVLYCFGALILRLFLLQLAPIARAVSGGSRSDLIIRRTAPASGYEQADAVQKTFAWLAPCLGILGNVDGFLGELERKE